MSFSDKYAKRPPRTGADDGFPSDWREDAKLVLGQMAIDQVWPDRIVRSCLSCLAFKEDKGEICDKWKTRPPARIIARGCDSYSDETDIPF